MNRLVIVGAGGHAREILGIVDDLNGKQPMFKVVGFLADSGDAQLLERRGQRLLGPVDSLASFDASYIIAIGNPDARRRIDRWATGNGLRPATLIHPDATVGPDVAVGDGVVIATGARVTTNVVLGRHTHLNMNCTVAHDCRLGDFVTVAPGATISGGVTIDEGSTIGAGATVIQSIHIGRSVTVGAGAVVIRDVPDYATTVGVPARALTDNAQVQ